MNEENKELANLLFPHINKEVDYYLNLYKRRELSQEQKITRFAPSPTGFVHIGGLFSALISERVAHLSNGIFYLRIEDTDKKREIEGGVLEIINALKNFDINYDEGCISDLEQKGNYGPYKQSERIEIYQTFAKKLVEEGKAYPCFCSNEELEEIRKKQESMNILTGYYGEWAIYRNKTLDEIKSMLEKNIPFVIRFKSNGDFNKKISYKDVIKGLIELQENNQDIVICKSDGLPTYHFAHVIDDYLMGTTHVIRGEEWLASVPIHIQLFRALGWKPPRYAHIPTILKQDGESKRKLSKRKDPEAAVSYYHKEGYPSNSVIEYLLNLANSNFEEWRKNNPEKNWREFPFKIEKIGTSGALFDLDKLNNISKNYISRLNAQEIFDYIYNWSKQYDMTFFEIINKDKEYSLKVFNIEKDNINKPRKDIAKWSDVRNVVEYMFDDLYNLENIKQYNFSKNMSKDDIKEILLRYKNIYSYNDDKETWFSKLQNLSENLGYAKDTKTFKANSSLYKGYIADTSNVIRVAISNRTQTTDLYQTLQVLGYDRVIKRIEHAISTL
ncbi:MAG: glutamate--tRNA ligase [Candidatus Sericytochromatia bacterium]|nr:MAG: glutamate--tRNA ligase [Candidatus Sericytochromatia bacterium]